MAIINCNSIENAKKLIDALNVKDVVTYQDCPWIQIGRLYVSVTIIGADSWVPLVKELYFAGQRSFTIFTGRHGNIPNLVDSNGISYGILDQKHYDEDIVRKNEVETSLKNEKEKILLELVDTSKWQKNHTMKLKNETLAKLHQSKTVIYGWCHSIFTFCERKFDKTDEDFYKILKNAYKDGNGQVKMPPKWNNKDYDTQLKAYNDAKSMIRLIESRDEIFKNTYSNNPISGIVGKYLLWVPR